MKRLSNKRALITGGTSGIGFETAKLFISEGAEVIFTGIEPEGLKKAQAELGPKAFAISANSASIAEQQMLANKIKEKFGKLDIAFINAGVSDFRPVADWDEESFDRLFDINVKGPFFLLQALAPVFNSPASVILNTSINAHVGMDRATVYSATKAALLTFAKTFSTEWMAQGIRINTVSPGPVDTPLYDKLGVPDSHRAQLNEHIRSSIPAGRFGKASEIASAVLYFASDESAWTMGSELVVDGGRLLNK